MRPSRVYGSRAIGTAASIDAISACEVCECILVNYCIKSYKSYLNKLSEMEIPGASS